MNRPLALLLICAASVAPAAPARSSAQAAAHPGEDGRWLREKDGEGLLRYLLADGVFAELESVQAALGIERTCELVTPSFERAVEELRPQWAKMFRKVASKFPPKPGNGGREAQLLLAIGMESAELLQSKVAGIAGPALEESFKVDPAIDYEAASERLSQARSDGRAWCGLRGHGSSGAKPKQEVELNR